MVRSWTSWSSTSAIAATPRGRCAPTWRWPPPAPGSAPRLRGAAPGGDDLFGHFTIADAFFAPVAARFTSYQVPLDDTCAAYLAALARAPGYPAWRAAADLEEPLPDHGR